MLVGDVVGTRAAGRALLDDAPDELAAAVALDRFANGDSLSLVSSCSRSLIFLATVGEIGEATAETAGDNCTGDP